MVFFQDTTTTFPTVAFSSREEDFSHEKDIRHPLGDTDLTLNLEEEDEEG